MPSVADLVAQIARDTATLNGDSAYHQPDADFYRRRIAAYRATVLEMQAVAEPQTAPDGATGEPNHEHHPD